MPRRRLLLAAILAMPLGGGSGAWAQTRIVPDPTPRVPAQPGQGLAAEDVRSLQRAARLSAAQVGAAGLAAEKAAGAQVKQLAARIGEDHARFQRAVAELAAAHGVALPDRQAAGIQDQSIAALRTADGEGFDRAFLARQLGLYRPMAELYQTMASKPDDGVELARADAEPVRDHRARRGARPFRDSTDARRTLRTECGHGREPASVLTWFPPRRRARWNPGAAVASGMGQREGAPAV
jgi:predicted outer membrane protein